MEQFLQVGVISSTHGIRGEVKVFPTTDDPSRFEELEEVILLSEFHLKRKSADKKGAEKAQQVSELDGKFHKVLYHASNSRILEHVLSDFHKYVKMARTMSVEEEHRAERSIGEHRAILEAIKARDEELAERLANEHIMKVMENLHIEE